MFSSSAAPHLPHGKILAERVSLKYSLVIRSGCIFFILFRLHSKLKKNHNRVHLITIKVNYERRDSLGGSEKEV